MEVSIHGVVDAVKLGGLTPSRCCAHQERAICVLDRRSKVVQFSTTVDGQGIYARRLASLMASVTQCPHAGPMWPFYTSRTVVSLAKAHFVHRHRTTDAGIQVRLEHGRWHSDRQRHRPTASDRAAGEARRSLRTSHAENAVSTDGPLARASRSCYRPRLDAIRLTWRAR